jgi:hypothetical protein
MPPLCGTSEISIPCSHAAVQHEQLVIIVLQHGPLAQGVLGRGVFAPRHGQLHMATQNGAQHHTISNVALLVLINGHSQVVQLDWAPIQSCKYAFCSPVTNGQVG